MNTNCDLNMGDTTDLTIVTVTYNVMPVIERCIASVQGVYGREGLRVEHLIIDGVSTDGTVDYLRVQCEQGRISRVISEPDQGIYDAMNKGIREAKGKIIVFINADDELLPEGVPACCAPILNGEAEYVYSSASVRDEAGNECPSVKPKLDSCFINLPCNHQAMFARTDLLKRMGGFRKDVFRIAADVDLMRRLHAANIQPAIVDAVPCVFYIGGVSSSVDAAEEWIRLLLEYRQRVAEQIKNIPEHAETLVNVLRYNLCMIAGLRKNSGVRDMQAMQWTAELLSGVRGIMPPAVCERGVRRLNRYAFHYTYRALYKWRKSRSLLNQARVCRTLAGLLRAKGDSFC